MAQPAAAEVVVVVAVAPAGAPVRVVTEVEVTAGLVQVVFKPPLEPPPLRRIS